MAEQQPATRVGIELDEAENALLREACRCYFDGLTALERNPTMPIEMVQGIRDRRTALTKVWTRLGHMPEVGEK